MQTVNINGEDRTVDAPPDMPLLWVLRDIVGLTGTTFGCGIAQCGACIVNSVQAPGGIGEAGASALFPAVGNAVAAATGKRIRKLPIEPALIKA